MIAKHLMFDSYGPLDRLLEIGVFLLIAYEVIVGFVRHRSEANRQKRVGAILATLAGFMERGQELQENVPVPWKASDRDRSEWITSVKKWTADTSDFLIIHTSRSGEAGVVFHLVTNAGLVDSVVQDSSGQSFTLTADVREVYQRLLVQLSNLRGIKEKPDVYF